MVQKIAFDIWQMTSAARAALNTDTIDAGQEVDETDTGNTYRWNGAAWQQTKSGGAVHVAAKAPGIETFAGSGLQATSIPGVNVAYLTVPAGCYAVRLAACKATLGSFTAMAGVAYIKINGAGGNTDLLFQQGDDITIGVNPGDQINVKGATSSSGQIFIYPLG